MANLVSAASGNFTAAATWQTTDTTSFLNSETNTTASTTSFVSSAAFTPGAITIDGIGLKISSRNAGGGTFSTRLIDTGTATAVAGTTVTTNSAAFSFYGNVSGWVFFKFAAPVTLVVATNYAVQIQSSIAGTVTVYRNSTAGNWSRFLRTTTTSAPAAADYLIICGEQTGTGTFNTLTVTMDETAATNYSGGIEISSQGILSYGTTASTNYQLRMSNNLLVNGGGSLRIGTSGTPIPSTSTANLEFIVGSNVQFGLSQRGDADIQTFGTTKTGRAYLNADAAAAATTITTDISTGWLSGDSIAIASTTTTPGQTELVTLSANATGTSVPVSALGFAHSGTSPTQAEIINVTRNVRIFGTSTTLQTFILTSGTSSSSFNYTELYFMGSATSGKRGVDVDSTLFSYATFTGCAFRNFEVASSIGINIDAAGNDNITVSDCVFYRIANVGIQYANATSSSNSFTNCWVLGMITNNAFLITALAGIFTGCNAAGGGTTGFALNSSGSTSNLLISNCISHSNTSHGFTFSTQGDDSTTTTYTNLTAWRNTSRGILINGGNNFAIDGATVFSNTIGNIEFITNTINDVTLKNMVLNGGSTPTSPFGVRFGVSCSNIYIENSTFGVTSDHSSADIDFGSANNLLFVNLRNTKLDSATTVTNQGNLVNDSYIGSSRHNQIADTNLAWFRTGTASSDTVIYNTADAGSTKSTRMTFANLSTTIAKSQVKRSIIKNGTALKISVAVRLSVVGDGTAFIGQFPRLYVKKNPAVGIMSDTLLATATAASQGAFEMLSGITATATDNGVLEFYVDFRSPVTGWCNLDSYKIEVV